MPPAASAVAAATDSFRITSKCGPAAASPFLRPRGWGRPVGTAVRDAALRSVVFTVGAFPALTSLTLRFARG